MAANSTMDAGARRGPQPLALAYLTVFVLLIVSAAGITFLGDPHAGDPVVTMDLPQTPQMANAAKAGPHATQQTASQPLTDQAESTQTAPPTVTQQVFAGRAL